MMSKSKPCNLDQRIGCYLDSRSATHIRDVTAEDDSAHQPTPPALAADTPSREFPRPRCHRARDGVCRCELGHRESHGDGQNARQRPHDELQRQRDV